MGLGSECSVLQSLDDNESLAPEDLGNLGESETKLKINGACHVEDVSDKLLEDIKVGGTIGMSPSETALSPEGMGSSSPAATMGLKKWRRIPRELVKKAGSNLDGGENGDLTVSPGEMEQGNDGPMALLNAMLNVNGNSLISSVLYGESGLGGRPGFATRADSANSEDHSSRSSTAASAPTTRHEIRSLSGRNSGISVLPGSQQRNGQIGTSKKARGFKIKKENSHSSMGSDSQSSNFVFVQGTNSVAIKGRQSGGFAKYDEEYSDDAQYADKHLKEAAQPASIKNDAESEDVAAENSWAVKEGNVGKHEGPMDQDALVESITRLHSAQEELEREIQKWRDVGKEDLLTFDDSVRAMLELKDAKILELESALTSGDTKTTLEDLLKKIIQAEVEYVAITTTTESLTTEPLHEIKLKLQQKDLPSQDMQASKKQAEKLETTEDAKKLQNMVCIPTRDMHALKKQAEKLETTEDVKKLQNRVCRFTSCFTIPLILLLVTLYLQFSSHNVEVVPT